jgi:LysM repeat protein
MAGEMFVSPVVNLPQANANNEDAPATASSPLTNTATNANSGAHDTKIFGNLQGRDPDLLFAGEKIMVNGKEVTVADGDTLSGLAAKNGTTVVKLIAENKMDATLLGKNGPGGAYFTPGGPQPAPGGSQTPRLDPQTNTASSTVAANATAAPTAGTASANEPSGKPPVLTTEGRRQLEATVLKTPGEKAAGVFGGVMDAGRASSFIKVLSSYEGGELTSSQRSEISELKGVLKEVVDGTKDSSQFGQREKDLMNKYGKVNNIALEPTTQSAGLA